MPFPPLDYSAVRWALDIHLDENVIPDEVIQSPFVEADAIAEVMARDPNADDYLAGTTNYDRVSRALIFLAAARLALAWRPTEEETHASGDLRFRMTRYDPEAKAAQLRGLAEAQFVAYLGSTTSSLAGSFALAAGRRGT